MPRRRIIPVFVPQMGCPNQCVFCNQRSITGERTDNNENRVHRALYQISEPSELAFFGGSFTTIPEIEQVRLLETAQPYRRAGIITGIRISTRPDAVDENKIDRLLAYGVETVELGAQSMCDRVLELSGRGHTSEDTRRAAVLIKSGGLSLILQMMTGLPGDGIETAEYTAKELISLKPDGVRIYPTVIIRDTPLYDLWRNGEYKEHTVEEAVETCARIVPLFQCANIPIIRLGLNPSEELGNGEAAAGAYHPALGELVYSRIMRERAAELLTHVPAGSNVSLKVNPRDLSKMLGQHRLNMEYLKEKFGLGELTVVTWDLPLGDIKFTVEI